MRFFKSKVKPPLEFTTLEAEVNGVKYGYVLNWFRRDGDNLIEVKNDALPKLLVDFHVSSMLRNTNEQIQEILKSFTNSLNEKIAALDTVIHDLEGKD